MKRTLRQLLLPAVVILAVLVPAAPASADWQAVLRDCVYNEGLQGDYKRSELVQAKRHVTGERVAYTECLGEISAAMSALPGTGGGNGGSGDGADDKSADLDGDGVVTPAEKKKAKRAEKRKKQAVASVNDSLTPDAIGSAGGDDSSGGVSGGLILALILLALAAAAGATWYAAQRNPAIANALRRVPVPGRRG